jgi:hypothetical protein
MDEQQHMQLVTEESMAKKKIRQAAGKPQASGRAEQVLLDVAEDFGRLLGTAQVKANRWLERETFTTQLVEIRDGVTNMLARLGDQVATGAQSVGITRRRSGSQPKKKTARSVPAPPGTGKAKKHPKAQSGISTVSRVRMPATAKQRRTQRKPG